MTSNFRVLLSESSAPAAFTAELSFSALTVNKLLNAAGSASVTIPLDSYLSDVITVTPADTLMWVERGGELIFGGIVWTMQGDTATNTATLSAGDFHSYYARRVIASTSAEFTAEDQLDIGRGLIDYANAVTDSLTIVGTSGTNTSGVTRTVSYPSWQHHNVANALEQTAMVNDGFDFYYETTYVAGVPTVELVCVYPNTGTATDIVFDLDAHIERLTFGLDGSQVATQVHSLGAGEGPNHLHSIQTEAGATLLQYVYAADDVSDLTELALRGNRQLAMRRSYVNSLTAVMRTDIDPTPDAYSVGDLIAVRASQGLLDIAGSFRIVQKSTSFSANQEVVTVTLADAAAFAEIV
jgi:hypothetical protein